MYLFFDTETTGVPKNYKAPITDVENWPRVTQFAWAAYNSDGVLYASFQSLIKPDGWVVPKEKFFIDNNMSTERCEAEGRPILGALEQFANMIDSSQFLIAHNISFDQPVIGAEMLRYGVRAKTRPVKICTMQQSTSYCALPRNKWPKLIELHNKLFNVGFYGAHDALADVFACARCFFELQKRGIINTQSFQ